MKDVKPTLMQFSKLGPVIFEIKCPYCGKMRYATSEKFFAEREASGADWTCDSCMSTYRLPEMRELQAMYRQVKEGEGDVS